MENNSDNEKKNGEGGGKKGLAARIIITIIVTMVFIAGYMAINNYTDSLKHKEITYDEFVKMVEDNNVKEV